MTRPLALAKLPQALRNKSQKVSDPGMASYLSQAAIALERQQDRINNLTVKINVQKKRIEELETAAPPAPKKPRKLDWSDVDTSGGDWWDAEPDLDDLDY